VVFQLRHRTANVNSGGLDVVRRRGKLVSLSEDARTLYINIGVEKIVSGGGIVHYYLAKVDLPDQEVTLLSRLLDIRF
jgi:hypothetical protein